MKIRRVEFRPDVAAVLAEHERQMPGVKPVIDLVRAHVRALAGIEADRYEPSKAIALVGETQQATASAVAATLTRLIDGVPVVDVAPEIADFPEHLLRRLGSETTVAGITSLLSEAEQTGALRAFAPYAMQSLRKLAGDEARLHRAPSSGSAFNALSLWSSKVGNYGRRIDPEALRQQRQRALRERGLEIAGIVGLRELVDREMRRASVPEVQAPSGGGSSLVFGTFFENRDRKQ